MNDSDSKSKSKNDSNPEDRQDELKVRIFGYLDDLRKGGSINMLGAASHIVSTFDISKSKANDYLTDWIKEFKV